MKTKTLIAALFLVPGLAMAATKTPSECVGLAQDACGKIATCNWSPALVKGQASPITGKPYVRDRKAHCRKRPARKSQSPVPQQQ